MPVTRFWDRVNNQTWVASPGPGFIMKDQSEVLGPVWPDQLLFLSSCRNRWKAEKRRRKVLHWGSSCPLATRCFERNIAKGDPVVVLVCLLTTLWLATVGLDFAWVNVFCMCMYMCSCLYFVFRGKQLLNCEMFSVKSGVGVGQWSVGKERDRGLNQGASFQSEDFWPDLATFSCFAQHHLRGNDLHELCTVCHRRCSKNHLNTCIFHWSCRPLNSTLLIPQSCSWL